MLVEAGICTETHWSPEVAVSRLLAASVKMLPSMMLLATNWALLAYVEDMVAATAVTCVSVVTGGAGAGGAIGDGGADGTAGTLGGDGGDGGGGEGDGGDGGCGGEATAGGGGDGGGGEGVSGARYTLISPIERRRVRDSVEARMIRVTYDRSLRPPQ